MLIGCVIQARLGSTRLPGKVLADIGGWPMLKHVVRRVMFLTSAEGIPVVVATPPEDVAEIGDALPELHRDVGYSIIAPDCHPEDLLKRHLLVGQYLGWDAVMRVTSDCPLIDPFACNEVLAIFKSGHYDYVANDIIHTYPDGLGCEIMSLKALRWADFYTESGPDRQHVSPWIKSNIWTGKAGFLPANNVVCPYPGIKGLKFAVDTQADLDRAIAIDRAKPADYSLGATKAAYDRAFPASDKT